MKLKDIIKSLDEVDAKYHDLYEQKGDEYHFVGADETDSQKRLAEFRGNNKNLFKRAEDAEKALKKFQDLGIDPERWAEAQEALAEKNKNKEKEMIDKGEIEALFSKRMEARDAENARVLKAKDDAFRKAQDENNTLKQKLGANLIDAEVQKAVLKAGKLKDGAIEDVISRARRVWSLDEQGNIIPRINGEVVFGRDGDQLTIEEWASDLPGQASHLFEASKGGGSEGSNQTKKEDKFIENDPIAIGKHLKEIAEGKLKVRSS